LTNACSNNGPDHCKSNARQAQAQSKLAKLPLFNRKNWSRFRFGEVVENVNERVAPSTAAEAIYVGLDDLDSDSLHIRRWGKGSDVIGTKLGFRKGDVIFGRHRAYQRKLAVAEVDGICSAHAMVARAKPKVILPEFLPFLMMSDKFMNRAVDISVGSLSPTINWTTLKLEEFDLPPLDQQRRLAEILWAVDEANEKQLELASASANAADWASRDIIANIETRRSAVTDKRIAFFAMVFKIPLHYLFPAGLTLNWPVDQ
jgi:restriction endonuclease S subunit